MGGFLTLVEDRPTPKNVYNWRVYACATVASFASCMIGYDSAFIGTTLALPSFVDEFDFDSMSTSKLALVKANIVSVYQVGSTREYSISSLSVYPTSHQKILNLFLMRDKTGRCILRISLRLPIRLPRRAQMESHHLLSHLHARRRNDVRSQPRARSSSHLRRTGLSRYRSRSSIHDHPNLHFRDFTPSSSRTDCRDL